MDKKGILTGEVFHDREPDQVEQTEKLRRLIFWFWHDLSHFITAVGRGQLWWAQGQLEILRGSCIGLARLWNDFSDDHIGDEVYFKLEEVIPIRQLSVLQVAFCPMDADAMIQSSLVIVRFYKELAKPLAKQHGLSYPDVLEHVMIHRLENL